MPSFYLGGYMVLKFDDVIYKKTFEINAKEETLEVIVEVTDKESDELATLMLDILNGKGDDARINDILFKLYLPDIKRLLIGFNFGNFQKIVLADFQNFLQGSISESINNLKNQ